MDKTVKSAEEAVARIDSGASIAVGGFGLCGIPSVLIQALDRKGIGDLELISNNCGVDDWGLGVLLHDHKVRRIVASYVGENKEFARQFLSGELEVELNPQGTLAERLRAAGAGIPAFYTRSGVGTQVAEGGLPWRYHPDGTIATASPAKQVRTFTSRDGVEQDYVMESWLPADYGLVRARYGDRHGNLIYEASAQNFNPLCAAAGRYTIAEVEELVEPGDLDPNRIHTPGVFVQAVLPLTAEQATDKRIEKVTTREGK